MNFLRDLRVVRPLWIHSPQERIHVNETSPKSIQRIELGLARFIPLGLCYENPRNPKVPEGFGKRAKTLSRSVKRGRIQEF